MQTRLSPPGPARAGPGFGSAPGAQPRRQLNDKPPARRIMAEARCFPSPISLRVSAAMTDRAKGSISHWLVDLQAGRDIDEAARGLWERYFDRLVNLARGKLKAKRVPLADEEDVALSAFDSFCAAAAAQRFPQLDSREDLWRLLVTITARKAIAQQQRERRQKRGGGRVLNEAALEGAEPDSGVGLDQVVGSEPTPEFAAQVADELGRLLSLLRDDVLRQIALLRMEGYTNEQVGTQLGCSVRSVERKLDLIRRTWEQEKAS